MPQPPRTVQNRVEALMAWGDVTAFSCAGQVSVVLDGVGGENYESLINEKEKKVDGFVRPLS